MELDGHEGGRMRITNHYIERYHKRVFKTALPNDKCFTELETIVREDMDLRMTPLQQQNMNVISGSGSNAKIPMGKEHLVVTENDTAITILYY